MRRSLSCLTAVVLFGACADHDTTTLPHSPPDASAAQAAQTPRERLAHHLALALANPATRDALARRLEQSHAPEGKLQFQALVRADGGALLADLARSGATTTGELLADLDAARHLEIYLPVEAHRAAWHGGSNYLVATQEVDGDAPIAFDATGRRSVLSPSTPPATPVIALVPQETDFTGGRPALAMTCYDVCSPSDGGGAGGGSGGGGTPAGATPGLMLTQSHFDDYYESWIKGKPEFEYHVYGVGDGGEAVQLACTGEHAGGSYTWDQNELDWSGSAMLLSESDRAAYERAHPGAPVRVVAYEDDDEACVPRVDANRVRDLLTSVDAAYKSVTSGKVEPWLVRGIKAAPSVFALLKAIRNVITTADDFIGTAVESSVVGSAPGGANWVLKTEGTKTTGWFTTLSVH